MVWYGMVEIVLVVVGACVVTACGNRWARFWCERGEITTRIRATSAHANYICTYTPEGCMVCWAEIRSMYICMTRWEYPEVYRQKMLCFARETTYFNLQYVHVVTIGFLWRCRYRRSPWSLFPLFYFIFSWLLYYRIVVDRTAISGAKSERGIQLYM